MIGMPDCSWVTGRWVLVHARIHAGIDVNIEAGPRGSDLCFFRTLIDSALKTRFQEAGPMW
jgi:hypothetical protein